MKYKKDTKCKYENTASEEHSLAIAKQLSIQLWNPNPSAKNTKYKNRNTKIQKTKIDSEDPPLPVAQQPSPDHCGAALPALEQNTSAVGQYDEVCVH